MRSNSISRRTDCDGSWLTSGILSFYMDQLPPSFIQALPSFHTLLDFRLLPTGGCCCCSCGRRTYRTKDWSAQQQLVYKRRESSLKGEDATPRLRSARGLLLCVGEGKEEEIKDYERKDADDFDIEQREKKVLCFALMIYTRRGGGLEWLWLLCVPVKRFNAQ